MIPLLMLFELILFASTQQWLLLALLLAIIIGGYVDNRRKP
jgi:hypothetical protein